MATEELKDVQADGYVDLGLPSKTLWSDKNVGAKNIKDNGNYFTFKEAQEQGNIPTKEQFQELIEECKWNWKGKGYEVVGKNGNSIFLPATDFRKNTNVYVVDSYGYYWSSSETGCFYAYCICFNSCDIRVSRHYRYYGRFVRLVK